MRACENSHIMGSMRGLKGDKAIVRIAICDDCQQDREKIRQLVEAVWKPHAVTEFSVGSQLVEAHRREKFDFIFLDILMPLINGMDTASMLRETDKVTPFVFLSSTQEFGVQSYRVRAFDYLLKPITQEEIQEVFRRYTQEVEEQSQTLLVKVNHVETEVLLSDILCLESDLKKIVFDMVNGKKISVTGKLSEFGKELLPQGFLQCHKSFLVNMRHIISLYNEEFTLTSGRKVKISRTYQEEAKRIYTRNLFRKH